MLNNYHIVLIILTFITIMMIKLELKWFIIMIPILLAILFIVLYNIGEYYFKEDE